MRFNLTIKLDNDEAVTDGPELALPVYLSQVADKCQAGQVRTGIVVDGNGVTIGQYRTKDEPGDWACRECGEPWPRPYAPRPGARCEDCGGEFAHQSDR